MPRKRALTWQPGTGGRCGRWTKKYLGRKYYVGSAASRSDQEAYERAWANWLNRKAEIDAEEAARPKPHQERYEQVIAEWELVLRWSVEHEDEANAAIARDKLTDLRARLDRRQPPPVRRDDALWSRFSWPEDALAEVGRAISPTPPVATDVDESGATIVRPGEKATTWLDGSPRRIEREVWRDRLRSMPSRSPETSLAALVKRYVAQEQAREEAGEIAPGRFTSLRSAVLNFRDTIGGSVEADSLTGGTIQDYCDRLRSRIKAKELAQDTGHNYLNEAIAFVRWLWEVEVLAELPRSLGRRSRKLRIGKKSAAPVTFSKKEVQTLLKAATPRTRLYFLLMLNIGAYQSDIANLHPDEVDWKAATITRKRTKSQKHESVPTVRYPLWPETVTLLREHRTKSGPRVLLNTQGRPLVDEGIKADGKHTRTDCVANAFKRLREKVGLKERKSLKHFRKTSATLIRGNDRFRGLEDLFLGHAPERLSDRAYAGAPMESLAEAVQWLRKELGIEAACRAEADADTSESPHLKEVSMSA